MSDDFADTPQTITELRSKREKDMSIWTPRDALIDLLRQIDREEIKVDALVVAYRITFEDGDTSTGHNKAVPDIHTALGLLSITADCIHSQRRG